MENKILFIHSAGSQTDTDGSTGMLVRLKDTLGPAYIIKGNSHSFPEGLPNLARSIQKLEEQI